MIGSPKFKIKVKRVIIIVDIITNRGIPVQIETFAISGSEGQLHIEDILMIIGSLDTKAPCDVHGTNIAEQGLKLQIKIPDIVRIIVHCLVRRHLLLPFFFLGKNTNTCSDEDEKENKVFIRFQSGKIVFSDDRILYVAES